MMKYSQECPLFHKPPPPLKTTRPALGSFMYASVISNHLYLICMIA